MNTNTVGAAIGRFKVDEDVMVTVFENGKTLQETTLSEIRERAGL